MYNGTEEVPDDVIWNVAPLGRKYANKLERWDAGTLCTQQYTLYIVGTSRHVVINHLQPVVEAASELQDSETKKGDLRGFFRVRITFIINKNPATVIVIHPAIDRAATLGAKHRTRFTDIINADVTRADDERNAQAARRQRAVPIIRRAVRYGDARRRWVVCLPPGTLKQRRGEGIHQIVGGDAHRRDLFVLV